MNPSKGSGKCSCASVKITGNPKAQSIGDYQATKAPMPFAPYGKGKDKDKKKK